MLLVNSDNSKLAKFITAIFAVSAIIGLFIQIASLLAMTKSRIGKKIRHNAIGVMYDAFDESIDEGAVRAPKWVEKLSKLG